MRGPGTSPSSIACLKRERRAAEIADRGEAAHQRALGLGAGSEDRCSRRRRSNRVEIGSAANIACQCASIRPGMRTRPPQSMTRAPSGVPASPVVIALTRPSSTIRRSPSRSVGDRPSNRRKFVNMIGRGGSARFLRWPAAERQALRSRRPCRRQIRAAKAGC